jgi:hypothetical protein
MKKWYRFTYRQSSHLKDWCPPLPDQYHEYEDHPGTFANWDVRGPFDTEEEAQQNGYEEGYE